MRKIIMAVFLFICSCGDSENPGFDWQKVYQNNESGESTFGNKTELIDAVRLGYPVRIGWGGNRVEHIADAGFITIFNEEVFAQIETIIGQAPSVNQDSCKIHFRPSNHWSKIAGTNGFTTNLMTNYILDSVVSDGVDRFMSTTWFVFYPYHPQDIEPLPLWRKTSPKWEDWNGILR